MLELFVTHFSSATCDEKLPKARELAGQGKLTEALDMLMVLEKQTRWKGVRIQFWRYNS